MDYNWAGDWVMQGALIIRIGFGGSFKGYYKGYHRGLV